MRSNFENLITIQIWKKVLYLGINFESKIILFFWESEGSAIIE
jgi:hypothetical protein